MVKLSERKVTADAEDLPLDHFTMESGSMSECVTMFALWDWGDSQLGGDSSSDVEVNGDDEDTGDKWPEKYYRKVRGFHGSGGFLAINLDSLFAGVPNDSDTKVFVCLGSSSMQNNNELKRIEGAAAGLWDATEWAMFGGSDFSVDREGVLSYMTSTGPRPVSAEDRINGSE
jgi:hypothetical protein